MFMFRGVSKQVTNTDGYKYTSDSGDYGRGEYWASERSFAEVYGKVKSKVIELNNALYLKSENIIQLAKYEYGTTINRREPHCRFQAS